MLGFSVSPIDSLVATRTRPQNCSLCNRLFSRTEHLKRHLRLHTGEKDFRCPCGAAYSRSDVLARHAKGCDTARAPQYETLPIGRRKRTRVKRACDQCARLKVKCDYESPCQRCRQKQLSCQRQRHQKPSEQHGDTTAAHPSPDVITSLDQMTPIQIPHSARVMAINNGPHHSIETESALAEGADQPHEPNTDNSGFTSRDPNPASRWSFWADEELESGSGSFARSLPFQEQDFGTMAEAGLLSLDITGFSPNPFMVPFSNIELDSMVSLSSISTHVDLSNHPVRPLVPQSFCLGQVDPVEARCLELKSIMQELRPKMPEEVITRYMNRQNLVRAIDSCGKHYQSNNPILHSPTFSLSECPPLLLLAMFCVGACYDQDMVPASHIFQIAMGILITIEGLPHERTMEAPPLSTIQASIAACCVLACSNDEIGTRCVGIYVARSISMARRAKIFDPLETIEYRDMSEATFDWSKWIERESRKRVACALFTQDVASCVFNGTSPSFSPLKLDIELPSYESCWIADSADRCLRELQRTPSQPRLAQALQQLRSPSNCEERSIFEASAFGMLVLIKGLHCLVWHAVHYDFGRQADVSGTLGANCPLPAYTLPDLVTQLDQGLSGPAVAKMADEIIMFRGSSAVANVNQDLESWKQVWTLRKYRDEIHENRGFALDPMPFWWLAKAFLMLNCGDSGSASSGIDGSGIYGHMLSQAKVFRWLINFRRKRGTESESTRSATGDSLVDLMQPINDDLPVS